MQLLTSHEFHAVKVGNHYYNPGYNRYEEFSLFLDAFDRVVLIVRCGEAETAEPGWGRIDGPGVEVMPIQDFPRRPIRPMRLLADMRRLWRVARMADAAIFRFPGWMPFVPWLSRLIAGMPTAAQVVGDPMLSLRPKRLLGIPGSGWMLGWAMRLFTRLQVGLCDSARYVTERHLQGVFPPRSPRRQWGCSNVRLADSLFHETVRDFSQRPLKIASVGVLIPLKGYKYLLEALARVRQNRDVVLTIIGGGELRGPLEEMARDLDISDAVTFAGQVTWGPDLFAYLDNAHLFVMPTLTEGLPRAVIEAMARGLPAISTDVGGIPELLQKQCLAQPGDSQGLAERIERFVCDPDFLAAQSARNYRRAQDFRWEVILGRKRDFWRTIIERAGVWRKRSRSSTVCP
ncbi:MAG: glycosyltransferase [Phycisphaerae bacterium]|nr:glycosyltransferase [Phycisphaerae bacterium]